MPVDRARQHHRDRVADALRDEISSMMAGELADPRIGSAFVTEVVLAPGGKSARIFVAVEGGSDADAVNTLEGLQDARGYIRHEVRERMGVRHVPELTFHLDKSGQAEERINVLLGRLRRRATKSAQPEARSRAL